MTPPASVKKKGISSNVYAEFMDPINRILPDTPDLISRGDRPLKLTFEYELKVLINYHLWENESARDLIQHLKEDDFAKEHIAPPGSISRSSFCEAINTRGLEQLRYVFRELCFFATGVFPRQYAEFGDIVAIDGTLIDGVFSMYWADYRKNSRKAKGHFGFDLNHGIPSAIYLTSGNGAERPFVSQILQAGQTGVTDRGYQSHKGFDNLQEEKKSFVCRLKNNTKKAVIEEYPINPDSSVFHDALVLLGTPGVNQTEKPVRLVGFQVGNIKYFVATDRRDLTAEQIAFIYKLRWNIEKFFQWWKKHLNGHILP